LSGVGAAGLGALAAEIGGGDFDGAAHFEEAGAHAAADALFERIFAGSGDEFAVGQASGFAGGCRIVEIVGGDDGGPFFVVARVENNADDVSHPVGGFTCAQVIEDENFDGANWIEDGHFGGFAGGVVAVLDFFEEFAIVAEEAGVAADDEFFECGDGEVRFADAGWAHEEETFVGAAGKIARESFGVTLGELEGLRVLRGPGFTVGEVGDVAFEIAMLVALGNAGALQDAIGAVFHAAVAGDCEFAGAVGAGDEFVAGAAAELAIFEGQSLVPCVSVSEDRIRVRRGDSKRALWTICESSA
jgi:hypothetical protein